MSFKEKYLKYKSKYLQLKKIIGGNKFNLSLFVFSRAPLTEVVKTHISVSLSTKYGGDITIRTKYDESIENNMIIWAYIKNFIDGKSKHTQYYTELENITEFQINQIPDDLKTPPMNDSKLTAEERRIGEFKFDKLSFIHPAMHYRDADDSRGWGLWNDNIALITLVESA